MELETILNELQRKFILIDFYIGLSGLYNLLMTLPRPCGLGYEILAFQAI